MEDKPNDSNPFLGGESEVKNETETALTDQPMTEPTAESTNMATPAPEPTQDFSVQSSSDISARMDSMMSEPAANSSVDTSLAPKKPKLPLIIILSVIGVLLIAGVVFGIVWLTNFQKPESVVLDAVTKTLDRRAAKITGDIEITGESLENSGMRSIKIHSSGESEILPSTSDTAITLTTTEDNSFEFQVGSVMMSDGIFYFKVEKLTEVLDNALPSDIALMMEDVMAMAGEIEGNWWKFDISEFGLGEQSEQTYSCVIDTIRSANEESTRNELSDLYVKSPLLDVKKIDRSVGGADGYEVSFNKPNLANFANGIKGTGIYERAKDCAEQLNGEELEDIENITADDIEIPEDMPRFTLFVEPWTHELKSVEFSYTDDGISTKGNIGIEFINRASVSEPTDARSTLELIQIVYTGGCSAMGATDAECQDAVSRIMNSISGGSTDDILGNNDFSSDDFIEGDI